MTSDPIDSAVLTLSEVSFRLLGRTILDSVSFAIKPGEFTGLIGANGAGKTTLFRLILGLEKPSAGTIRMNIDLSKRPARTIGYVPQKTALDPDVPLRARDLVALGLDGHRLGIPMRSAKRSTAIEEMLDAVDAQHFADSRVGKLSGGEQQRILIAHALISKPNLLLLDEPLANLDIGSAHEIIALLSRITVHQQVALLLSAHEMNPLLPVMDRIAYIAGGRVASGTTEEVVRGDVLSQLYGRHVDVVKVHGRILVVAGAGTDDEALLAASAGRLMR